MLESRIDDLEAIVARITPLVPQLVEQFQQKAMARMQEALGLATQTNGTTVTSRDEVLERIYIGRRFRNDTERLEKLFDLYTKMTASAATKPARKAKA